MPYSNYSYDNYILKVNNVLDDLRIVGINYQKEIMENRLASAKLQDMVSLIQTAEGALDEIHSILQRMNELAVQAANETNAFEDLYPINQEMEQLVYEINFICSETLFDVLYILNTDISLEVTLPYDTVYFDLKKINSTILGVDYSGITSVDSAIEYLSCIWSAIEFISSYRSYLGSKQNSCDLLAYFYDLTVEHLDSTQSLDVTRNLLASSGLEFILYYLNRIINLEEMLEYMLDDSSIIYTNLEIQESIVGIDIVVNSVQLDGLFLLKGDYSFIPNVSSNYLGEGEKPLFVDTTSSENILKSKNDAIYARDKIVELMDRLSNV